jgi:subtilase family serine protease
VVIPAGTAVGNYYLLVRGDDSGQVVESNETNNLGGRLITIR